MTASQIIACAISAAAAIVAGAAYIARRARRRAIPYTAHPREHCGALKPGFFENSESTECVLRPQHSGSHADEHGTRWRLLPAAVEDGAVCEAYRLPTTAESSGLCARCGMSDYKHHEARHA